MTASNRSILQNMMSRIVFLLLLFFFAGPISGFPGFSGIAWSQSIDALDFRITDAEYSESLNRLIMISESPRRQLHIYDPITQSDRSVDIALTGLCVSVGPDGHSAAVGHDGFASLINLDTATVSRVYNVTAEIGDLVLAGNGYMYAFPELDQWVSVHSIHLETGVETLSSGHVRENTSVRLHPSGASIYGADNGISPSDIEKYVISNGPVEEIYDSPYHGDYPMCGDLWLSKDGFRIFTKCGRIFRSSDIREEDMTYNGSLSELEVIESLDHAMIDNKVYVLPGNPYYEEGMDIEVQVYDYTYCAFENRWTLPQFDVGGTQYAGHGRYVFSNADSTMLYVVIQADEESGLLNDYGIVSYSIGPPVTYDLQMPETQMQPGSSFLLQRQSDNPGNPVMVDEYILLDIYGTFWFWPGWTSNLDYRTSQISSGSGPLETILSFSWPSGAGSAQDLKFWGAFLHAGTSSLINFDMLSWGFSE